MTTDSIATPQRFRGRDGYVVRSADGRYVLVSRLAFEVRAALLAGRPPADLVAAHPDLDADRYAALAAGLAKTGLLDPASVAVTAPATSQRRVRAVGTAIVTGFALGLLLLLAHLLTAHPPSLPLVPHAGAAGGAAYLVGFAGCALAHEYGHHATCMLLGAEGGRLRIAFVGPRPMLVTRVNGSWVLPPRQRAAVAASGSAVSFTLAAFGYAALRALPTGASARVVGSLVVVNMLGGAVSMYPFLKFDGYYVLSHLTGEPNLMARGYAAARTVARGRRANLWHAAFGGLAWCSIGALVAFASLVIVRSPGVPRYVSGTLLGIWLVRIGRSAVRRTSE